MTQARDELFLKLALRQGLFSQQEAREFLVRYRTEGGAREGIGEWLVAQGIVAPENAQMIRNAIARRAEGHVDTSRRRVPKRAGGGGGAPTQPVRHHRRQPRGVKMTSGQQALYIGAGVLTLIIAVGLVFAYQKQSSENRTADLNEPTQQEKDAERARELERERQQAEIRNATAAIETPTWSDEEIASMKIRIDKAALDAKADISDQRPARGVRRVTKELTELGEKVPPSIQQVADEALATLEAACDQIYGELLVELRSARDKNAEDDVADIILEIEERCGPEYAEKAKVAP